MIAVQNKKKYPPLEDKPFAIPDLSKIPSITSQFPGAPREAPPIENQAGISPEQYPALDAPVAAPPGTPQVPSIATDQPVNMGYGRTMDQFAPIATEQPFQPQAQNQPVSPVKQLSPLAPLNGSTGELQGTVINATPEQQQQRLEQEKTDLLSKPVPKQGKAAQVANFALQAIEHIFNPNDRTPYEWLGNRKRDYQVGQINHQLAPLQAQETYKEKMRASAADRRRVDAQTGEVLRKPEKEQADREFKILQEVQKQQNRLEAKAAERAAKGLATKYGTAKDGSGRVVIVDGNGKEEFVTQPDGSFEYNELERPTKRKLEDGTEISVKGSQALSNETQKKIAEASLALNKEKFVETKRSNRVREAQAQQHLDEAKRQYNGQMSLRRETETRLQEARQSGDTVTAERLAMEKTRLDTWINERKSFWKTNIGKGGFEDDDYEELTGEKP